MLLMVASATLCHAVLCSVVLSSLDSGDDSAAGEAASCNCTWMESIVVAKL